MKDKASSVIVELPHTNCTRGDHISVPCSQAEWLEPVADEEYQKLK